MDPTGEFPMRKVDPLPGLDEILAAAAEIDPELEPAAPGMTMLVDPITRCPILPLMPEAVAHSVLAVFQRMEEHRADQVAEARDAADALLDLCIEANSIAGNLGALAYLFGKALDDEGDNGELTSAGFVVIDSIKTMAARLNALDARAWTIMRSIPAAGRRA